MERVLTIVFSLMFKLLLHLLLKSQLLSLTAALAAVVISMLRVRLLAVLSSGSSGRDWSIAVVVYPLTVACLERRVWNRSTDGGVHHVHHVHHRTLEGRVVG